MSIPDLQHYFEKKLTPPPGFNNSKWNDYIDAIGVEGTYKLFCLMRSRKHTCNTPYHYLLKYCAFALFAEGYTPADANVMFDIPISTACDYYREFSEQFNPELPGK